MSYKMTPVDFMTFMKLHKDKTPEQVASIIMGDDNPCGASEPVNRDAVITLVTTTRYDMMMD